MFLGRMVKAMPTIELTKEQLLSVIEQFGEKEWRWIEEARKNKHISGIWYRQFTKDDSLWKAVGIGRSKGGYVARNHDKYIYRKDW
jgi:hypothetical protein